MPWTKPKYGRRPFYSCPYDDQGRCPRPDHCVLAEQGEADESNLVVRHYRRRKCGPTHPLLVLFCVVHKVSFTVYPLGFTPFSRTTHIGEQGSIRAAMDKSLGITWPEQANPNSPTRKSENRWIRAWGRILGLSSEVEASQFHLAATQLGIPTLELVHEARAGPTLAGWAQSITKTTGSISLSFATFCTRGTKLGFWGPPSFGSIG